MIVDELLHSVIPVLFITYWLVFVPKAGIEYKGVFKWLLYPLIYVTYTLIRGTFTGFYPYPFINLSELGFNKVLLNSTILTGVFLGFSLLYAAICKAVNRDS
jgi:hypothetical protein